MTRVAVVRTIIDYDSPQDMIETHAKIQPGYISHSSWRDSKEQVIWLIVRVDGDVWEHDTGQRVGS